jgi:hypothetical protein
MAIKQRHKRPASAQVFRIFNYGTNEYSQVDTNASDKVVFISGPSKNPSVLGLNVGKRNDLWRPTPADPPAAPTISAYVAASGFTWTTPAVAGFTDYKIQVSTDANFNTIVFSGVVTGATTYAVAYDNTAGDTLFVRTIVMKSGFEASLPSAYATVNAASLSMYDKFVALGLKMFRLQETSGAVAAASSGSAGAYVGTIGYRQDGLVANSGDKSILVSGAGYLLDNFGTPTGDNLKEFISVAIVKFVTTTSGQRIMCMGSATSTAPGLSVSREGSAAADIRTFFRLNTNAIVSGTDINPLGFADLLPHALVVQCILVGSNYRWRVFEKEGAASPVKLFDVDLGTSIADIDVTNWTMGAWLRNGSAGNYANAYIQWPGRMLGGTQPSEAQVLDALSTIVF